MRSVSVVVLFSVLTAALCHPTLYKIKDDKLEPDLIPVSSTVIPLPIYRVETSFDASAGKSTLVKPDGPVTLLTVHGKKPTTAELKQSKVSTYSKDNEKQ